MSTPIPKMTGKTMMLKRLRLGPNARGDAEGDDDAHDQGEVGAQGSRGAPQVDKEQEEDDEGRQGDGEGPSA